MALPELGEKIRIYTAKKDDGRLVGLQPYYCKANALTTMFLETP